jgi:hypothetical protein
LARSRFRSISFGMPAKDDDDRYSEKETAQRADAVIKQMLNTPPKPRTKAAQKSAREPNRRRAEPNKSE